MRIVPHQNASPQNRGLAPNQPAAKTMSSVELVAIINDMREAGRAELRHDHFMAKIEKHPGIDAPKFRGVYLGGNGQERPCYNLPRRECELMIMSESQLVQTKVYDRLAELEAAQPARTELSRMELIELAYAAERERMALAAQVEADAPKVAFAEAVRNVDGLCSMEKIAKTLGWGRNRFIAALKGAGVLQDSRIPYQKYMERGYFEVVEQSPWEDSKGVSHPSFTTMVTGAGQVWLAKNFQRAHAAQQATASSALKTAH